mmetsp:Transcript_63402/g.163130  ORF Transcript_63402/g.163130 Transcript_63402/m.163130 type:complete len:450 (+) Transcript_63402:527-1876(+)
MQRGVGDDHQRAHCNRVNEEAIAEHGVDRHEALAHVEQTLSNAHHEQHVGILGVVRGELPEQARQPSVVGSCADETHGDDGAEGDVLVCVMGELGEGVDDTHLRVREIHDGQRDGYRAAQRQLAVLQDVVQRAHSHLGADLLAAGDEADAEHGSSLVARVCLLQVLGTLVEHLLHVEHVAGVGEGQAFDGELGVLADWVRDGIQCRERGLHGVLLAQVEQAQAHCEEVRPGAAEGALHGLSLDERLQDCLRHLVVAGGDEDLAEGDRSHGRRLDRAGGVHDHWCEVLHEVLAARARVGVAEADHRSQAQHRVLGLQLLAQQRPRRVALVLHTRGHEAEGEQGARLQVRVGAPLVLVDLRQALVDTPEEERTERPDSAHHAHVLVLVHPLGVVHCHELILAEARVDEGVDEGRRKVLLGGVQHGGGALLLKVGLVDLLRQLRFEDVKLLR